MSKNMPVSIYLVYSHEDAQWAQRLETHLAGLRRHDQVTIFSDRKIAPGSEWSRELDNNLNKADLILLLISSDFLASDYTYSVEMRRALQRQEAGEAYVLPILVRPTDWRETPLGSLQMLPSNAKPLSVWPNQDEAWVEVVRGIREIIQRIDKGSLAPASIRETTPEQVIAALPKDIQNKVKAGNTVPLQLALQQYKKNHPNERVVLKDDDGFVYYENVEQVTYIWQLWQTLGETFSKRSEKRAVPFLNDNSFTRQSSKLLPLLEELSSIFSTKLNIMTAPSIVLDQSSLFFSTFLDIQHIFTNLVLPKRIPLIFYTRSFFNPDHTNELRQLLTNILPADRLAVLCLFTKSGTRESQRFLKDFQRTYSYDVLPLGLNEFLRITEAREPGKMFRQWVLSQVDLTMISPFSTSGPAPERVFFGREKQIRTVMEHAHSASYALVGGRRIGKTSIMKHLTHLSLPQMRVQAFYQDCSTVKSEADLVQAVSFNREWFPQSPSTPLPSFAAVIQILFHDRPIVFLLDEIDKPIKPDKSAGYPLLYALRSLANSNSCQFVFAGEYTLLHDIEDPYSPLYNFANKLPVGNLDPRDARELLVRPMHDLEIEFEQEEQIVARVLDFTAGHPNVIQRLCERLLTRINWSHRRRISMKDIESVLADSDFLRADFLHTYWGQATSLERLCTLIIAQRPEICTLEQIHTALSEWISDITFSEVQEALDNLVNLRSLFQSTPQGYVFAVKGFAGAMTKTHELTSLTRLISEQFIQERQRKTIEK